jgi:predicted Rossmann fold nucleotide-binding protein DprA/Smf involved in DNA uptake
MKIAIIGSRTFSDYNLLKKHIDTIKEKLEISLIVSGGSKGADLFGEKWAIENNIQTKIFLPDWDKFGKRAGFM